MTAQSDVEAAYGAGDLAVAQARRRSRIRKAMRRFAALLLVVACSLWLVTLILETADLKKAAGTLRQVTSRARGDDTLLEEPAGDDTPVAQSAEELLPATVDGWIAQGIQPVPGSDGRVVEGNYTPEAEQWSVVTPLAAYAQATGRASGDTQIIDRALSGRYRQDHRSEAVGGTTVRTGVSSDGWSYFMGWEKDGNLYALEVTFRYRVPESGGDAPLRAAGSEMARAIIEHKPGQGGAE